MLPYVIVEVKFVVSGVRYDREFVTHDNVASKLLLDVNTRDLNRHN